MQSSNSIINYDFSLKPQIGGILALFLGISIISILECFCYLFYSLGKCCCGCFGDRVMEDGIDAVEPLDNATKNWNRNSQSHDPADRR